MATPATLREIRRACRHHGITTIDALDLTQRQIDHCCSTDVLRRVYDGVYADPTHPPSALQDLAAAVAAGGPACAAWGRSAGVLWRMWPEHPTCPEVVVPYGRPRLIAGATVHRSRALEATLITSRDHIRVTKPLVTVLDIGVVASPTDVGDVIIRGLQLKLFSVGDVRATIDRFARPGRTGMVVARNALEMIVIGTRPAQSVLEFRFHLGPARHGLPPYSYQHEVRIGRKKYLIDFAYPDVKLAIEVNGYEFHASPASQASDMFRRNQLSLAGWSVLEFDWTRVVKDAPAVAIEILTKLEQLGYRFRTAGRL